MERCVDGGICGRGDVRPMRGSITMYGGDRGLRVSAVCG